MTAGPTYAIRVRGHLDDHWSARLGGAELRRAGDGTTTVTVADADQARLHGVLAGLRDLGVELVDLRATSTGSGATAGGDPPAIAGRPPRDPIGRDRPGGRR